MATRSGKDFKWTDDECELMLSVTRDYKVQKMAVNVDWESVKTKYEDILAMMQAELPVNAPTTRSQITGKDYPHAKSELTKAILTTKLKAVRQKYRKAVDTGRKSGQGRVVLLYFDLCEAIWAGSPSTEQIDTGLESRDLQTALSEGNDQAIGTTDTSDSGTTSDANTEVQSRRDLLDKQLSEHRHKNLKRKINTDVQLLKITEEELEVKKRLLEKMEKAEDLYQDNMAMLSSSMQTLSESISQGFTLIHRMMSQEQHATASSSYYSQYGHDDWMN